MTSIKENIINFIVDYYKKTQFYPSYDEIAQGVNRTKSTIHVHMNKLEEEGIVIRKCNCSSQYRLINMNFLCNSKK